MNIKKWFSRGLWPFSADPATLGEVQAGNPLLICGNSRHEHALLRRYLGRIEIGILALDCGGLSLQEAHAQGNLTLEQIIAALRQVEQTNSNQPSPRLALLPHQVWLALGGAEMPVVDGWSIQPAPDDPSAMKAFINQGCRLDDRMKSSGSRWRERLLVGVWHWVAYVGVASFALIWFGWQVWLCAALMGLVAALAAVLTLQRGKSRLAVLLPVLTLLLLAVLSGALAGVVTSSLRLAGAWLGAQALAGLWMGISVSRGRWF